MDTLNKDCLSQIFLNLDFTERVRLEHVCRMFHYVLQDSLSFLPTVVGVIARCGCYVEQLSFGQRWLRISQPIIDCIANNCNRLSVVDFGAVILDADLSPILDRIAPQLQEFSLEETSWVNIEYAEKVKRILFLYLEIGGAHSFPSEVLVQFLENHEQLEQLHASPVPVLDQDIISAISSMKNLRHLSLGHSYSTDLQFSELCNLMKLESLHLNKAVVVHERKRKTILLFQNIHGLNDASLRVILSRVQNIEQISLINCKNILDYTALGCCVQLHSLEIRNTMQLANEDIYELCTYGNLKRLILSNCFNFSSRGVNIALMRCQLKEVCAVMGIYLLPLRPNSR
uniref:F-box domain-containing protein n=1 Tax=Angiostrongylus cantonensis TaxID=6313 RepID=A0A0K0DHP5_ANGCA